MPELTERIHLPRFNEFPDIDLYADQVITYLNTHLALFNNEQSSHSITRTMINNYVKQGVVSSPVKKKYNRKHLAYLFVVCILKNVFSISEICELIQYQNSVTDIEKGYDMFCTEMENAIVKSFNCEMIEMKEEDVKEVRLLKQTVSAVANKLYMQKIIAERIQAQVPVKKKK